MTVTPDTQQTEQEQALLDHIDEFLSDECVDNDAAIRLFEDLEPLLAAIRRQAAADALRKQAKSFENSARMFREMSKNANRSNDQDSDMIYWTRASQAMTHAEACRREADGIIAEGYEYECAGGCETPVPDAGDECAKCYAEGDDEDRWAE